VYPRLLNGDSVIEFAESVAKEAMSRLHDAHPRPTTLAAAV